MRLRTVLFKKQNGLKEPTELFDIVYLRSLQV